MDFGIIIGIPLGFAAILISIFVNGYSITTYADIVSVFITIVGSFAAVMVASPMSRVTKIWTIFSVALRKQKSSIEEIIPQIVSFSEKSRREGLLSLEDDAETLENEFFKQGIRLVVDGVDPDVIKRILYNEMNQIEVRHTSNAKIFDDWGKLAPAFGMIGTLYGLIGMLRSLGNSAGIGVGMAAALITTFYGAILANLIFIPIKSKLDDKHETEMLGLEIIMEGILSIQMGDNPRIVEQKLLAFLPPKERQKHKTMD